MRTQNHTYYFDHSDSLGLTRITRIHSDRLDSPGSLGFSGLRRFDGLKAQSLPRGSPLSGFARITRIHSMHNAAALPVLSRNAQRESSHYRGANAPRDSACPSAERIPHRSRSLNEPRGSVTSGMSRNALRESAHPRPAERYWHSGRSRNGYRMEAGASIRSLKSLGFTRITRIHFDRFDSPTAAALQNGLLYLDLL
jgi:hypothetical protein